MKTLTEKYNAVLEGAFPKKQFVRDAKLSHPNFITQFTSYEDAVKILKNKGLVYETKKEEVQLNLPLSALDKAIRYELEKAGVDYLMAAPDTDQYLKAKAKAEKALVKDRLYYLELNTSKKTRTDVMEPATAKNVVDKGNEMKKVKALKVESVNESISQEAARIHAVLRVGQSAAQIFIDDNELDGKKLADYVSSNRGTVDGLNAGHYITGEHGTVGGVPKLRQAFIKQFKKPKLRSPRPGVTDRDVPFEGRTEDPSKNSKAQIKEAIKTVIKHILG